MNTICRVFLIAYYKKKKKVNQIMNNHWFVKIILYHENRPNIDAVELILPRLPLTKNPNKLYSVLVLILKEIPDAH